MFRVGFDSLCFVSTASGAVNEWISLFCCSKSDHLSVSQFLRSDVGNTESPFPTNRRIDAA